MPVATPFAAGIGNGFPFCPTKVNVSGYDYWTTLSGFNKDSGGTPSQASIDESLNHAMNLFWNAHKLNCVAKSNSTISSVRVDYIEYDLGVPFPDPPTIVDQGEATPVKRVCIPYSDGSTSIQFDIFESDSGARSQINPQSIVAMYDSSDNFLGYGFGPVVMSANTGGAIFAEGQGGSFSGAGSSIGGYGSVGLIGSGISYDAGYTSLSGLHGAGFVWAVDRGTLGTTGTSVGTIDLANLMATSTFTFTAGGTQYSEGSLSSIDFYTYA